MPAPNTKHNSVGASREINQAYWPISRHLAKGFKAFYENLRKILTASTTVLKARKHHHPDIKISSCAENMLAYSPALAIRSA